MSHGYGQFVNELARLLLDLRVRAGLSQEALASQLRWDQATVSRIEAGRRKVEVAELLEWVEETGGDIKTVCTDIMEAWYAR